MSSAPLLNWFAAVAAGHTINSITVSPTEPVEDSAATFTVTVGLDTDANTDLDVWVWDGKVNEPTDAAGWTSGATMCTVNYVADTTQVATCTVSITYVAGDAAGSPYTPKAQLFAAGDTTTLLLSPNAFAMSAVTVSRRAGTSACTQDGGATIAACILLRKNSKSLWPYTIGRW